jgi:hypothetical protein
MNRTPGGYVLLEDRMHEDERRLHAVILGARHTTRFRRVSIRYPRLVNEAYRFNRTAALADSDERVAARVAEWERGQGLEPCDWRAIGRYERGEIPVGELGQVERGALGRLTEE